MNNCQVAGTKTNGQMGKHLQNMYSLLQYK